MDSLFEETPGSQDEGGERGAGGGASREDLPLARLKLHWQAEKASPEVLAYQGELVDTLRNETEDMESRVAECSAEPQRSLEAQIMTMDLDRARFVLRSYLRCRVLKIDKYFLQIFADADLFDRLSKEEQDYCDRCIRLTQKHLDQSVLQRMPSQYANMIKQSDSSQDPDMIPQADLDTFVFCKAARTLPDVQLDPQNEDTITLQAKELHVLLYRPIRELALDGSIQLI